MKFYDWSDEKTRTEVDGYKRGVAAGDNIMMAHVELEAGAITAQHSHAYEEIIYVVHGRWQITFDGNTVELKANQTLVIPPDVEHSSTALEATLAVVSTNYRPEWRENSDYWLHYKPEDHLWAV